MPAHRPTPAEIQKAPPDTTTQFWHPWAKLLISALVVLHLTAVISAPLAVQSMMTRSGPSPAADGIRSLFWPYISAFYLDHGYAFFAPDPGPNHLVDYTVEFADGRPPVKGRFPDLKTQRPRLLYHRHFMLSEALNTRSAPPRFDPEPSPPPLTASSEERERFQLTKRSYDQAKTRWEHARKQYEAMQASIAEHLKRKHGGQRVILTRIEHLPADPEDISILRRPLNAAESYREMSETGPEPPPARGGNR